ncbi:MAG: hypothetical protein JWP31_2321 [Aeromicrobium sp.]|nr:hypothetical protein [Aeromicrobium sp.]
MAESARCHPVAPWPEAFTDQFVAQVRELLGVRPVLAIVGPVGGNRNRLAALVAAAPEEPVWWRHVARFGERNQPYFALRQILRSIRPGADDTPQMIEAAAIEAIRSLGAGKVNLVLGNVDLYDQQSIEVLAGMAMRGAITIVATLQPNGVQLVPQLMSLAEVVELPPLDHRTVAALLRVRYGLLAHPAVVDVVLKRSEGAYGAIREIVDAACAAGTLSEIEGAMAINPDQSRSSAAEFGSLHPLLSVQGLDDTAPVRDLVELTAVLGYLEADEVRASLGSAPVADALAHGALRETNGLIAFSIKAESMLVARGLPQERLTALFEQHAEQLPGSLSRLENAVRAADWWRSAGRTPPVELAARAAKVANLSGRHRRAVVFTDPQIYGTDTPVAPGERAFALFELGEARDLDALFESLDPLGLTEEELVPYLRWVARLSDPADREQRRDGIVRHGADATTRRRREAVRSLVDLLERAFEETSDDTQLRLRAIAFSALLSPANRALAFTTLSALQRHAGLPRQAVESADFALRLLREEAEPASAFHLNVAQECQILALITLVDLPRADRALEVYSAGPFGRAGSGRMATGLRAMLEMFKGDMQQALVNARLSLASLERVDPHHIRGWVEAILAQVLVQFDRVEEARDMLARSDEHRARRLQHDLERRISQACAHDALAEPERALEILREVYDTSTARGIKLIQVDAAVLSVQIGGPPHLDLLFEAVDGLVDPSGTPALWQEFASLVKTYDVAGLIDLAERLAGLDAKLFAAEVAQYALDVARRASDLDEATRRHLRDLAHPVSQRNPLHLP